MAIIKQIDVGRATGGTVGGWEEDAAYMAGGGRQSVAGGSGSDLSLLSAPAPPETIFGANYYSNPNTSATATIPALSVGTSYKITLYFTEHDTTGYVRNQQVSINGAVVLSGFNPQTAAGGVTFKPVERSFVLSPNSAGQFVISYTGGASYTELFGIKIETVPVVPVASFSRTPASGVAPLAVGFTDTSTGQPDTWLWDFGDGTISSRQSPSHTYTTPGIYLVSFTATNSGGTSTAAQTVTVLKDFSKVFTDTSILKSEYHELEPNFDAITDTRTYQDGGKSFHELGDTPVLSWRIVYDALTRDEANVYRDHFLHYRNSRAFNFLDKNGVTQIVFYQKISITHQGHKSWNNRVEITLIKYPSVTTVEFVSMSGANVLIDGAYTDGSGGQILTSG